MVAEDDNIHYRSVVNGLTPKGAVNVQIVDKRLLQPDGGHREKDSMNNLRFGVSASEAACREAVGNAYVALPLKPREWKVIPDALESVRTEFEKLREAGTFGVSGKGSYKDPCSWARIKGESEAARRTAEAEGNGESYKGPRHGMIFLLCVLKNSEIKELQKYKGRFVFQGNNVRDEFGLQQLFPDQGSGASFIMASRVMDAISLLPGCTGQQSDAPQAYTQSEFGCGLEDEAYETWCDIPSDY